MRPNKIRKRNGWSGFAQGENQKKKKSGGVLRAEPVDVVDLAGEGPALGSEGVEEVEFGGGEGVGEVEAVAVEASAEDAGGGGAADVEGDGEKGRDLGRLRAEHVGGIGCGEELADVVGGEVRQECCR